MPSDQRKAQQAGANRVRATQEQIRLRLQQIYNFLRDGQRTADIYRLCAIAREREITQRAAAETGVVDNRGVPVPRPLTVWGDDELPKRRQLDAYIAQAKKLVALEGEQLSKESYFVLGAQHARILDVYSRALADKKYHAALRAIEIINRMFGLEGAIKLQLLPTPNAEQDASAKTPPKPAEMTAESAFLALREIASRALARAQAAGQLPADVTVERILLGNPVAVIPHSEQSHSSTNGDER